jgi:hypothetical protein
MLMGPLAFYALIGFRHHAKKKAKVAEIQSEIDRLQRQMGEFRSFSNSLISSPPLTLQ